MTKEWALSKIEELKKYVESKDAEKVFVPKGIGLYYDGDLWIINPKNQSLSYCNDNKNYDVFSERRSDNENTGSNFELVKVDKPEAGKLYFVTDQNNMCQASDLSRYKLYLDEEHYCYWIEYDEWYATSIGEVCWDNCYEVRKVE